MKALLDSRGHSLDPDDVWFRTHAGRFAHIRTPYEQECESDFKTLGDHDRTRRRIVCVRVPEYSHIMRIPFLLFSDEEIADDDVILLPLVHEMMEAAASENGMEKKLVKVPDA